MKRICSLLLALLLLCSLGAAACAAGDYGAYTIDSHYWKAYVNGYQGVFDFSQAKVTRESAQRSQSGYDEVNTVRLQPDSTVTIRPDRSGMLAPGCDAMITAWSYAGEEYQIPLKAGTYSVEALFEKRGVENYVDVSGGYRTRTGQIGPFRSLFLASMGFESGGAMYNLQYNIFYDGDLKIRAADVLPAGAYYGDPAACAMDAKTARGYADILAGLNAPIVRAVLVDAGGGMPLLWVAYGEDGAWEYGASDGLTGTRGSQVYGLDGGKPVRYPTMTKLLRAGENGVIVQERFPTDFGEDFSMFRLSGGRIADAPFATGSFSPFSGWFLNGEKAAEWDENNPNAFDLMQLWRRADADIEVVLSATDNGMADFMTLGGNWTDATVMRAALSAYAEAKEKEPKPAPAVSVRVNGVPVVWTDAAPFIDENWRTMVPLRAVGDALGLTVDWDAAAREAIFTDGTRTLFFPIGSTRARTGDGGTVEMDTAAIIVAQRTYAPVRYLAEYFGWTVGWDAEARTVLITK